MITDIHAHLFPREFLEWLADADLKGMSLERHGEEYRFVVNGRHFSTFTRDFYDADRRLQVMDEDGVDTQVLTLAPPMVFWAPPDTALHLCQMVNDYKSELASTHPERFIAGAAVPLQSPALAADELRRAVVQGGHRMVLLGSNIAGTPLDDPSLEPFWDAVEELDVAMYVHPIGPTGAACSYDYRLDVSVGFTTDTTLAAARIILSGLLDRRPSLRFCWAHLGGSLPWLADRLALVRDTLPGSGSKAQGAVDDYLRLFWFDTTVVSHRTLRFGVDAVGAERLMFGTDTPFFGNLTADILHLIRTADYVDESQRRGMLHGNARTFLGR